MRTMSTRSSSPSAAARAPRRPAPLAGTMASSSPPERTSSPPRAAATARKMSRRGPSSGETTEAIGNESYGLAVLTYKAVRAAVYAVVKGSQRRRHLAYDLDVAVMYAARAIARRTALEPRSRR